MISLTIKITPMAVLQLEWANTPHMKYQEIYITSKPKLAPKKAAQYP